MARRCGSATALNTSELVEARGMTRIYMPMWECVKGRVEWPLHFPRRGGIVKHGARNQLTGRVESIQEGDIMSLIKFEVTAPAKMASVITTESLADLKLKVGD